MKLFSCLILFSLSISLGAHEKKNEIFGRFEYGFLATLIHKSKWGETGTEFNYTKNGGQDVLFPNWRVEAGWTFSKKHKLSFLYQPIFIQTEVILSEELTVDNVIFPKNTNLSTTYNFPFYRASYWYLLSHSQFFDFWLGGGLQIRNADIRFKDLNSKNAFRTANIGPVPLINLASTFRTNSAFSFYMAATGFWAPIKYLNGGSTDINGWIYEFEFVPTYEIRKGFSAFANLRFLGGGAIGTSKTERSSGGKYSRDELLTMSITMGLQKSY